MDIAINVLSKTQLDRRAVLAGAASVSGVGLTGCLSSIRAYVERNPPQQVSLTIKTLPADDDVIAVRIARHLAENLERAGIDVELLPTTSDQLFRDVLINRDFDVYVAQHPGHSDPDFLYPFLHSRFIEEPGWQNPMGYANVTLVDDLLESQRRLDSADRQAVLDDLQRAIVEDAPFVTVAFPDAARAVRLDRFQGWQHHSLNSPLGYLAVTPVGDQAQDQRQEGTIHIGTTDRRISRNRNPIAVEFRFKGVLTRLLYDSLGQIVDGSVVPWLAESWSWNTDRDQLSLHVRLREDLRWHDGEPLDAEDAVFTYRFLADTTMDDSDPVIPAPRFRGESSLVDQVWLVNDRELELRFGDVSRTVAIFATTVPILPKHIWDDLSEITELVGLDLDHVTEALVWQNEESIGSGPFRYEDSAVDDHLTLGRNDEHFLSTRPLEGPLTEFENRPAYDRLVFQILPGESTVVELIRSGELDATAWGLSARALPSAGRGSDVSLRIDRSSAFYHIGFNNRNAPLSNPRFRSVVSRLIDREYILDDVFNQYATPAISPVLIGAEVPADLQWETGHEHGFIGVAGSGQLDDEVARDLFRDAGYLYRDGALQMQ